jgi:hypothetical protein
MTSLQKRTAETLSTQRTPKTKYGSTRGEAYV